jgi:hypothetical protein
MNRTPTQKRCSASVGDLMQLSTPKTSATAQAGGKKRQSCKPLLKEFRRDGFTYRQIYRKSDFAIYRQSWRGNEHSAAFEIIRIRQRGAFQIGDRWIEPAEVYPCSKKWGELAWTVQDKGAAFRKLQEIAAPSNALMRFAQQEVER